MVPIYKAGLRFRFAADSGIMRELIDFIRDKLLDNEGSRIVNPKNE